jgi:2-dehydro-3-deoxyphosphooctonate aldolase (KDO 8-P synthase)
MPSNRIRPVRVGRRGGAIASFGGPLPVIIAGPCVIESEHHARGLARKLRDLLADKGLPFVFKASWDKANRTSHAGFRGPGLEEGLAILRGIGDELRIPVTTDVHESAQVPAVAAAVDLIQVPAFLCRQTDLVEACARSGTPVSIKKGQFLAPWDCRAVVSKFRAAGGKDLILIERGATHGYNNLVVDFRSLPILRSLGVPAVFDGTHAVQMPGGGGDRSSGNGRFAPALMRAALAVGVEGLFLETHEKPERSPSDGPNMVPLKALPAFLDQVLALHGALGRPAAVV